MKLHKFILPIAMVISSMAFSQESNVLKTDSQGYIQIDLSKSHPTNRTLDHLYYLNLHSISIELPLNVIQSLENIPDGDDDLLHLKLTHQRTEILKVLYNPKISPKDKEFICGHYLNVDSLGINPIKSVLQNFLDNGFPN